MSLLTIVLLSGAALLAGYWIYGSVLSRLLRLDAQTPTPAIEQRDDVDFVPIESKFLFGQHFSAIAAAGPIVGPIAAGVMFGWMPALLWIIVGSIFIGGVHDLMALVASVRHKARSIAEVVREHMTRRSYVMFLLFVWLSLVYVIVAFTDVTAGAFLGAMELQGGGVVTGGGIAASSLLYLALPVIMGLLLRYTPLTVGWGTVIFLPLVLASVWFGQMIPLDLAAMLNLDANQTRLVWDALLLGYCFVASLVPMWLLLQPRGHLGGCFLYLVLLGGALGVLFGGQEIRYPAFKSWETEQGVMLFPFLFITVACGACSGFHSIVASGTTSKQLKCETDARAVGYGSMLLEGMVAVVSLACVMMLAVDSPFASEKPNVLYALGVGNFLEVVGIPASFGVAFGLMAFTTFVYDTLDVCTRLGRYVLQELFGANGWKSRWLATAATAGAPMALLLWQPAAGSGQPAWRVFWSLFGASNQLLAALTLLGVTVWLWRTRGAWWVWPVVGLPTAWMYVISMWALLGMIGNSIDFSNPSWPVSPVPYVAVVLAGLGALMLVEAVIVLFRHEPATPIPVPLGAEGGS